MPRIIKVIETLFGVRKKSVQFQLMANGDIVRVTAMLISAKAWAVIDMYAEREKKTCFQLLINSPRNYAFIQQLLQMAVWRWRKKKNELGKNAHRSTYNVQTHRRMSYARTEKFIYYFCDVSFMCVLCVHHSVVFFSSAVRIHLPTRFPTNVTKHIVWCHFVQILLYICFICE